MESLVAADLKVVSLTCDEQAVSNKIFVGQDIYKYFLNLNKNKKPIYVQCKKYIFQQDLDRTCPDKSLRMGKEIRKFLMISQTQDEITLNHYEIPERVNFFLSKMTIGVRCPKKLEEKISNHEQIYDTAFKNLYTAHFVSEKQNQFTKVEGVASVQFDIEFIEFEDAKVAKKANWGIITDDTDITFKSRDNKLKIISKSVETKSLFKEGFNFEDLEVGGLDNQIQKIFRRAFMTRRLPQVILEKYGGNHTKGMLLFGPPGTGKTLIARKLSKVLQAKEPKIVNGPEIFNKFVGEAEKAIRDLFADAAKDSQELGDDSPLHVIVFDEFDAIAKPRGMHSDSTGVGDNVVNQLLTMVDGVDSLNNILVIGMTNRKDQIDPAILRPGRFEVHIEVGLPDEAGRQAILKIHTKKMRESKTLGSDVDLGEIAKGCKNFTGAEIETLVRAACQFGLIRKHNLLNFSESVKITEDAKIEKQDFEMALTEIKPQFGVDEGALDCYLKMPVYEYGPNYDNMYNDLKAKLIGMVNSELRVSSLLQFGDRGVGKTTLACKLAKDSGVPFIKIVSSDMLVGRTEHGKVNKIAEFFTDAYKSKVSLIILDEIERLIEYVMIGSRFSNGLLQALLSYMKKMPNNEEHRIVIIGTSAEKDVIKHFGFNNLFGFKGGINRLYYKHGEIDFVQNKMIPELAANNIKITLDNEFSIPIKDLIFILSSLKFKWKNHMPPNWKNNGAVLNSETVTNWFKMLYSQSV